MEDLRDNRRFWGMGEVLKLSWPASLSMLNSTIMRFVDGLMVSFIGPTPFSAQLVGGMASFVPESFATGLLSVVNTYVAQNFGAKRLDKCGQYAWSGLYLALAFCLLVLPLIFFARPIFSAFNSGQLQLKQQAVQKAQTSMNATTGTACLPDRQVPNDGTVPLKLREAQAELKEVEDLRDLEIMYFRYMVAAILLTLTARPIEQFFYGVHRPRVVLFASVTANLVNVALGYALIFGTSGLVVLSDRLHLGLTPWLTRHYFPGHGLEGGAWGNLISWGLYLAILMTVFLSVKFHSVFATRLWRQAKLREVLDLLRIGWPAGVEFLNDVLPWSLMLAWLIGQFGTVDLAATTAAMRWMPISFMPAVGIGIATTALVGRYLGQGQPHIARRRTHAALVLALVYMGFCGLIFFLFRYQLVSVLVTVAPTPDIPHEELVRQANEIIRIGGYVMICAAVFQLFDAVGIVFIGALRGAGDTFWPMVFTLCLSWGLTVGGGYFMVHAFPQLRSIGPWMAASLYVMTLGLVMAARFGSGAWKRIDLLHREHGEAPPGETPPSAPTPPVAH